MRHTVDISGIDYSILFLLLCWPHNSYYLRSFLGSTTTCRSRTLNKCQLESFTMQVNFEDSVNFGRKPPMQRFIGKIHPRQRLGRLYLYPIIPCLCMLPALRTCSWGGWGSAMAFWRRAGSEGRAETGTRFIRRESEVGAGRIASYELFSGAMCCWVALASWS